MAMTGTEAKILDALLWSVGQIVTDPPLSVSYPNVAFTPPAATGTGIAGFKKGDRLPYLAVTYLPNTAELFGQEFDSDVDHQGLLQVSVFWPAGAGLVKPSQVASQVAAAFVPGTKIDRGGLRIRIDRNPVVSGSLQESDWAQIPITVRWRAFVPAA